MERPFSGLTAAVKLNGTLIGYINNVELNLEKEIAEILQFGAQYKEKLPTIKDWSASCEGTAAFTSGESQHKLYQAFESGEFVTLTVKLSESTYFEGQALISSLSISGTPSDAMSLSAEFAGSGGLSFTLPETVQVTVSSGVGGTTNPAGIVRAAKGEIFNITVIPAAGKEPDKYFVNGDTTGTAITGTTVSLTAAQTASDVSVNITFKDAE